ncbi:hypothetical protein [Streptomyces sp. CA-210063]|uniref:hypothetical protein n=1 Tax=Streptomyces sp. CA-210063 TaxID=2801029 RepID=UPI003FA7B784
MTSLDLIKGGMSAVCCRKIEEQLAGCLGRFEHRQVPDPGQLFDPRVRHWISASMRGQDATLERLRVDRQLEEALTHGPDPLHLAEVFGLDEKTAMRYADSTRAHYCNRQPSTRHRPWEKNLARIDGT